MENEQKNEEEKKMHPWDRALMGMIILYSFFTSIFTIAVFTSLFCWTIAAGLPTPWGIFHIDLIPPGLRLE